ncbi:hypothetical protein DOS59_08635, partial [Staphylococcus felis]
GWDINPKIIYIVWLAFPRGMGRARVSTLILFPQASRQQYDVIYMSFYIKILLKIYSFVSMIESSHYKKT